MRRVLIVWPFENQPGTVLATGKATRFAGALRATLPATARGALQRLSGRRTSVWSIGNRTKDNHFAGDTKREHGACRYLLGIRWSQ